MMLNLQSDVLAILQAHNYQQHGNSHLRTENKIKHVVSNCVSGKLQEHLISETKKHLNCDWNNTIRRFFRC